MIVKDIHVLDKTLPICGKNYAVGRITDIGGKIPPEFAELLYPEDTDPANNGGKQRVTDFPGRSGAFLENYGAIYMFVEDITEEDGETRTVEIVETPEKFISPFGFSEEEQQKFIEYFLGVRARYAGLTSIPVELEDTDDGTTTKAVCYCITKEKAYIEQEDIHTIREFFTPEEISKIRSDAMIQMVFAETLTKGVEVYNNINFYDKAQEIADIISKIQYINDVGVKGCLNITGVENLLSNVKDKIKILPADKK